MTDSQQARMMEALLDEAYPSLYFADLIADSGFLFPNGAPSHPDAPTPHWMLEDLSERVNIAGGKWNSYRFVEDAIRNRDKLLPHFQDLKKGIVSSVFQLASDADQCQKAKEFQPSSTMSTREAIYPELLREYLLNQQHRFSENDAMDLIHSAPASIISNLALFDKGWCHKINSAATRFKRAGVHGDLAKCFHSRSIEEFFTALDSFNSRNRPNFSV